MAKQEEVKTVRLRNVTTGALVEVAEGKEVRLGSEWEPVKAPARKAAASDDK